MTLYKLAQIMGFALASVALFTPALDAQTVISNEHLVSTTFVVSNTNVTASCTGGYCNAKPVPLFKPIHVTCPAAMGKTCTLNVVLDGKSETSPFALGEYQFLLDGKAPVPGPTHEHGFYLFTEYLFQENQAAPSERQTYSASVVGRVTNAHSRDHKIELSVACADVTGQGSCEAIAHWSTTRIDVFEP